MKAISGFPKDGSNDALTGWGEIAAALGCSVRTAQRWAKAGRISVYRSTGNPPPRVCARKAEIAAWREQSRRTWRTVQEAGFAPEALTEAVKHRKYIWGWKAIAGLLNLSVSTVQLWEREAKLPVHRLKTGRRALPYILEGEISAWVRERTASPQTTARVDARLPLLMHSFLDAWPGHIAVLDVNGTIIAVNKAWRALSRSKGYMDPNLGIGRKYFEVCTSAGLMDAPTASRVAHSFDEFSEGKRPDLKVKYRCDGMAGKRTFLLAAARIEGLTSPFFVLCHYDVTPLL